MSEMPLESGFQMMHMRSIFVGDSFLHPLTDPKECPVYMANVTFEPGCRITGIFITQIKVVDRSLSVPPSGGVYQEWGKEPQILHPGDVVYIKTGCPLPVNQTWFFSFWISNTDRPQIHMQWYLHPDCHGTVLQYCHTLITHSVSS